jgi:DNA-binding response OmpR family regulator
MRILLVEDEIRLTDALSYLLGKENINVDVANDGSTGLLLAQRQIYDAIVLDIMLPEKSGLDILKAIRKVDNVTPVLLLTARDAIEDRVRGLDLGADDYLVKPFATQELFARIRSLVRRASSVYSADKLSIDNVEYDRRNCILKVDGKEMSLSVKEGQLLEMFMRRPGQVFTKEQILDKIWGYDADVLISNVEVYIHHLRKKLKKDAGVEIKTVRNAGYMLKER